MASCPDSLHALDLHFSEHAPAEATVAVQWREAAPGRPIVRGAERVAQKRQVRAAGIAQALLGNILHAVISAQDTALRSLSERVSALEVRVTAVEESKARVSRVVAISSLNSDSLLLKEPLYVTVEESEGSVVAYIPDLEAYGHGDCESEAIADLKDVVAELYQDLKTPSGELGPLPRRWLAYLQRNVCETRGTCN